MSKLLILLLTVAISGNAYAFKSKEEKAKEAAAKAAASKPAPVAKPAAIVVPAQPAIVAPVKVAPASKPKSVVAPHPVAVRPEPARAPTDSVGEEDDESSESLRQQVEVKPKPVVKKAEKKIKAKPAAPAISPAKQQELATLEFLKKDPMCGASTTRNVSTTGSANSYHLISNVYTRETAPTSVKKLIEQQVDECDRITKVGKYYVNPSDKAVPVAAAPAPASTQAADDVVGDSAKKVGDFFNKLGSDMKNNGVQEKVCSPGETQMHVNGC